MKTSKVYFRFTIYPSHPTWYCVEYPPFNHVLDAELAVLRAKSMLGLHKAADRIFYIEGGELSAYTVIKTDGVFEYPEPKVLREMRSYTPEALASFLEIKPLESLNAE